MTDHPNTPPEAPRADEARHDAAVDQRPPAVPTLQAFDLGDLGALGAVPGLAEGAVCAIDDPDCEVPVASSEPEPGKLAPGNPTPSEPSSGS